MPASGKCTYAQPRHRPSGKSDDSVTRPSGDAAARAAPATSSVTVSAAPGGDVAGTRRAPPAASVIALRAHARRRAAPA